MDMKKSSRRAGAAIVGAVLIVGLMPSVASAAYSDWMPNNQTWYGTLAGVHWKGTINEPRRVQVVEVTSQPGSIGCRVIMGGSITSTLWGATVTGWSSQSLGITDFQVMHY